MSRGLNANLAAKNAPVHGGTFSYTVPPPRKFSEYLGNSSEPESSPGGPLLGERASPAPHLDCLCPSRATLMMLSLILQARSRFRPRFFKHARDFDLDFYTRLRDSHDSTCASDSDGSESLLLFRATPPAGTDSPHGASLPPNTTMPHRTF